MTAPGLNPTIKQAAKHLKAFEDIKHIPKEPPQITGKTPMVTPLHIGGRPIIPQNNITVNNNFAEPSFVVIALVGCGSIFVGLFISGVAGWLR